MAITPVDASIPLQGVLTSKTLGDLASVNDLNSQAALRQQQAKLIPGQLQAQQQEAQMRQLQVDQAQRDQADQQTLRAAMGDPANQEALRRGDLSVLNGKVQPKTLIQLQSTLTEAQKNAAILDSETLKNNTSRHDALQKGLDGLLQLPEDQRSQAYSGMVQSMQQSGLTKGLNLPPNLGDYSDDSLNKLAGINSVYGGIYDAALKRKKEEADTAAKAAEATGKQTQNLETQRTNAAQELGTVSTPQDYSAWQQRNPGISAPPAMDPNWNSQFIRSTVPAKDQPEYDIKAHQAAALAKMTPQTIGDTVDAVIPPTGDSASLNARTKAMATQALQMGMPLSAIQAVVKDASDQLGKTETAVRTAQATAPVKVNVYNQEQTARNQAATPSSAALDMMAEKVLAGENPPGRNPALIASVYQRASELAKERGMNSQQAVLEGHAAKANTQAFNAITKQYETLKPFAEMADRNASVLEQKMNEVTDLGTSLLNTPIRDIENKFGSTKVAALKAALLPVQADFARILNSPTGGGVLSDNARHEMEQALPPGATVGQIKAALDVFRTDNANRKATYEASLQDLKARSVSTGNQNPAPPPNMPPPPPPPPRKVGDKVWYQGTQHTIKSITPDGKAVLE